MFPHAPKVIWNFRGKLRGKLFAHALILEKTTHIQHLFQVLRLKTFSLLWAIERGRESKKEDGKDEMHSLEKDCKIKAKLPGNHLVLIAPVILNKENNNINNLHLTEKDITVNIKMPGYRKDGNFRLSFHPSSGRLCIDHTALKQPCEIG